jgi:YidC/Oxa1 family membrane protein insertase
MKFYKENKINPYASCLPIVFQIPIFIGLFFVLRDFKKEIFCARDDVCETVEGTLQVLPQFQSALEWLSLVNITEPTKDAWGPVLIAVYVASQLTSTYLMSTAMQSKAQRWMIMVLPILFLPFILSFPSGLMIYWLTTNLWTTGQGIITRRLMPRPVAPPKRSSRTPPKEATAAVTNGEPDAPPGEPATTRPSGPPRRVKKRRGGGRRR